MGFWIEWLGSADIDIHGSWATLPFDKENPMRIIAALVLCFGLLFASAAVDQKPAAALPTCHIQSPQKHTSNFCGKVTTQLSGGVVWVVTMSIENFNPNWPSLIGSVYNPQTGSWGYVTGTTLLNTVSTSTVFMNTRPTKARAGHGQQLTEWTLFAG